MRRFFGLKIGTGEMEKVLIDEFGSPTKEGFLAAELNRKPSEKTEPEKSGRFCLKVFRILRGIRW